MNVPCRRSAIGALAATGLLGLAVAATSLAADQDKQPAQRGGSAAAASATGATIRVQPSRVRAGGRMSVYGYARGCPDAVSLVSRAFSDRDGEVAGVPAIKAKIRNEEGYFRTATTIPRTRRPDRYTITGRCGGGNIGARATVRVLAPAS